MPSSLRLWKALLSLLVFASLTLAALQNVTVDDAVLVGPVVPEYLPYSASWNLMQDCTSCIIQPDPSKAYNGTWHGTTLAFIQVPLAPGPGVFTQQVNVSFTGSAVYIFFILAESIPCTNVSFILDDASVGAFVHLGSGTTDFQYNVSVYSNNTLPYGLHNMMMDIQNPTVLENVMIFDYLIYTTNVTDPSSSVISSASPTSSPSQASSTSGGKGSATNNAAIAGGVVGGMVALLLVIAGGFILFRRYKRRKGDLSHSAEQVMIEDSPLPTPVTVPVPFRDTPSPDQQTSSRVTKQQSGSRTDVSSPTGSVPNSPSPAVASISSGPTGIASAEVVHGLLEQMELLREEVAHIARRQRNEEGGSIYEPDPLPPPQYSESIDSTRRSR